MKAWGGTLLFGFQTYFLQCLSNYLRCRGFRPIAVFTPRLNGISKAETSSSSIPFGLHFHIHHLPTYIAPPFLLRLSKNNGCTARIVAVNCFTPCASSAIHSFFHNKRCRRSNYSVKPICSRGDAAARYQLKQKEVCVTLPAIPKLLSKISHFHVISIELLPGIHMHTVTKSCCMPKPSCHIRYSCTSLIFLLNHNVIPDL